MINHIAMVMDGNRRWAKKRGLIPMIGHSEGVNSVKSVIEFCLKKRIRYVSLYMFSIENFKRSTREKSFIFNLLMKMTRKNVAQLIKQGVRVRFVGDRSLFPDKVKMSCQQMEQETAHLDKLHLNLLFCYGGRQEIVESVKRIARKVKRGQLSEDDISEDLVKQNMWSGDIPDPEIIVRTGGAHRLSNFLLYQSAYSELYFLDCLWPDITMDDLEKVYEDFMQRKRNFGK